MYRIHFQTCVCQWNPDPKVDYKQVFDLVQDKNVISLLIQGPFSVGPKWPSDMPTLTHGHVPLQMFFVLFMIKRTKNRNGSKNKNNKQTNQNETNTKHKAINKTKDKPKQTNKQTT